MDRSAEKHHQGWCKAPPTLVENTTKVGGISHQSWCDLFMRLRPLKTADAVAADIGASPRTVQNWMSGVATPSLSWFLRLVDVYGVEVLAHVLPRSAGWIAEALMRDQIADLEAERARIDQKVAQLRGRNP